MPNFATSHCQSALVSTSQDLWLCHDPAAFEYIGLRPKPKYSTTDERLHIALCFQHAYSVLADMAPALEKGDCVLRPMYVPQRPLFRCSACMMQIRVEVVKPVATTVTPSYCPNCGTRTVSHVSPELDYWDALSQALQAPVNACRTMYDIWLQVEAPHGGNFMAFAKITLAEALVEIEADEAAAAAAEAVNA